MDQFFFTAQARRTWTLREILRTPDNKELTAGALYSRLIKYSQRYNKTCQAGNLLGK